MSLVRCALNRIQGKLLCTQEKFCKFLDHRILQMKFYCRQRSCKNQIHFKTIIFIQNLNLFGAFVPSSFLSQLISYHLGFILSHVWFSLYSFPSSFTFFPYFISLISIYDFTFDENYIQMQLKTLMGILSKDTNLVWLRVLSYVFCIYLLILF